MSKRRITKYHQIAYAILLHMRANNIKKLLYKQIKDVVPKLIELTDADQELDQNKNPVWHNKISLIGSKSEYDGNPCKEGFLRQIPGRGGGYEFIKFDPTSKSASVQRFLDEVDLEDLKPRLLPKKKVPGSLLDKIMIELGDDELELVKASKRFARLFEVSKGEIEAALNTDHFTRRSKKGGIVYVRVRKRGVNRPPTGIKPIYDIPCTDVQQPPSVDKHAIALRVLRTWEQLTDAQRELIEKLTEE